MRNRWPRNAGLRLDHLLLSKPLARKLRAAGVDREVRGGPEPATTRRSGSKSTSRPRYTATKYPATL